MAAYAALTSLKNIIHNLHNHPSPPISIDERQVRSVIEVVSFLQEFLRGYNSSFAYSEEADPFETRIADAAYKAEDVIESEIVDRIHNQSPGDKLYGDLQLLIEEMDLIKKETMTINTDNSGPQLQRNVSIDVDSSFSNSFSPRKNNTMVGSDDALNEVLQNLMGSQLDLKIIPITGMGGIGKTTLARNIFQNACVKEHFDIRAWTTISQDYNARRTLKELLRQAKVNSSGEIESELGLELYQHLSGRRYLVVMDDMWSIEVWDRIRRYFPNYKDGSRIIVTTRQSNLASHLNNGFTMKFLDEVSSWNLFSKIVFGEESFPLELEYIGKKIVRNCRGLPLSIVATGGFLAKSEQTQEYWEHVEGNLNSIVNSEDHEYCLRILKMSYNSLPIHLKPCFLYMGVFEEDFSISVSTLVKLWVSEGFLEPTKEKALETIAKENVKDLVDRNLILVDGFGCTGNIKYCKIHDLLRDLCLREAEKERFYHILSKHIPKDIDRFRRVIINQSSSRDVCSEALPSVSHIRSITFDCNEDSDIDQFPLNFRLLRTLKTYGRNTSSPKNYFELEYVFQSVNLRYLAIGAYGINIPFSINLLWNLQTLIVTYEEESFLYELEESVGAPIEMWNMPHLRHAEFFPPVRFPDPPTDNVVIMENLETLDGVMNLKFNQDVVIRIPNMKKLVMFYQFESSGDGYCLNYLECLHKLESFECIGYLLEDLDFLKKLTFPESLKKLRLDFGKNFEVEEMLEKAGSLAFLQKFVLRNACFTIREWVIGEDHFRKLEFLSLQSCHGLENWTLESSHFPLLKKISLGYLGELKEISSEIGDIPTLQKIVLESCSISTVMCLKKVVEEQEELQGVEKLPFHVEVFMHEENRQALQRFAGPNFTLNFSS